MKESSQIFKIQKDSVQRYERFYNIHTKFHRRNKITFGINYQIYDLNLREMVIFKLTINAREKGKQILKIFCNLQMRGNFILQRGTQLFPPLCFSIPL